MWFSSLSETEPYYAGIETPAATQPGMVSNCNKFAFIEVGTSCDAITSEHGITIKQFSIWNKGVGETYNSL
jgi:hypothetical protein